MADPPSRRGSLRLPRVRGGNSRNSSLRAPAAVHEDLQQLRQPSSVSASASQPQPQQHPLRTTSSRYSLNEQFAATRQEYELWDDDASSIFERTTNASDAGDTEGEKVLVRSAADFGILYNAEGMSAASEARDWDYYDVLCLPRDRDLSQDEIRRAYYRLFLLFYPDSYPEHLRPIAHQQFLRAQEAFEGLIDPARRAQYDVDCFMKEEASVDATAYESAFHEALRDRIRSGIQTTSDLGIRLDATWATRRGKHPSWQTRDSPLKLLDFALSHSVAVGIPALRNILQPQVSRLERLTSSSEIDQLSGPTIELTTPTLIVSGSVYGVAEDVSLVPTALLFDRYQPLLPLTISRQRLMQLVESKLSPLVTLKYHQELVNHSRPTPGKLRWVKTGVELESDALPEPSVTARLYHHFTLPNAEQPTIVEASVRSSRHLIHAHPRVTLGAHQDLFNGTGFVRVDSGDWKLPSSESCRHFTDFSKMNPNMFSAEFPLKTSPTLELGFDTTPVARISDFSGASISETGIRGLDANVSSSPDGSWAVSASATSTAITGFVRYSRDLAVPFLPQEPDSLPPSARIEVELCSNSLQDQYLALRNLWSVGRFAKFGLEVGLSAHNLHLSVYWSRLGQRISLPLLISPRALFSAGVVFWAGALPFASLAALQLVLQRRKTLQLRRRTEVSAARIQLSVARRRYEADNLTVLLAQPVEAHQKRQMALGGLVILSAKFGILDDQGTWTGDQLADVTIALAALMEDSSDGGRICIPKGVKKSRVPGFWDPAPGKEKTLRVEYSWKGVEAVVDVRGRDELTLPPAPQST